MTFAALIAAYQDRGAPGTPLRATLPLAGRTLLERQARLATTVGASRIVILVEQLPAELVAAIDRLRSEGISPLLARSVAEAADAVPSGERLLLVGDGLIGDASQFARIAAAADTAVLTLPDRSVDDRYERIDADSRWAGLALVDGAMLHEAATMPADWDLQSTLLRQALQGGARQVAVGGGAVELLVVATSENDLVALERRIVAAAPRTGEGWVSRLLLGPVERIVTQSLLPTRITATWLYVAAAVLTAVAAILLGRGWLWPGYGLLLLATPLDGSAARLAALRMQPPLPPAWWRPTIAIAAAAALLALAYTLARTSGWGCLLLGGVTILFMLAQRMELRSPAVRGREWLAERRGLTWLMLPFAAAGQWTFGLGALALCAAASFFWAQREAHRALVEGT